jgi:hypothetical protein
MKSYYLSIILYIYSLDVKVFKIVDNFILSYSNDFECWFVVATTLL